MGLSIEEKIKKDTEFLAGLLIDPNILTGETTQCETEVGRRALDIYNLFEVQSRDITFACIQDLTTSEGSQIGNPGNYLNHIFTTAGLLRSLVITLGKIHSDLDLPHPDVAYSMGLIHDLNATFSDYGKGGQQSKEFDEFLLAKRFGWDCMENQVSMHSDYLGAIRLMAAGADFPKKEAYVEMTKILKGDGPLSYNSIENQFRTYLEGRDNFPLILLTVADYMANNAPFFNINSFEEDFRVRTEDIMYRYYGKAVEDGQTPSLLGQALVNGGRDRITSYKGIIGTLLRNDPKEIELLHENTKLFKA